jgi:hypothetical protein
VWGGASAQNEGLACCRPPGVHDGDAEGRCPGRFHSVISCQEHAKSQSQRPHQMWKRPLTHTEVCDPEHGRPALVRHRQQEQRQCHARHSLQGHQAAQAAVRPDSLRTARRPWHGTRHIARAIDAHEPMSRVSLRHQPSTLQPPGSDDDPAFHSAPFHSGRPLAASTDARVQICVVHQR